MQNVKGTPPFIGPQYCVDLWTKWGVPKERCIVVKPGDRVQIGDIEIIALESFDRTCLVTAPPEGKLEGICPTDMDLKAVNYLIKTPGGNIYHSGDSHYSNYYAKHGNEHQIDVALGSYGENPRGITDKMTSIDILRMAEALNAKVVIPVHYDVWTNMLADQRGSCLVRDAQTSITVQILTLYLASRRKYTFPNDLGKRSTTIDAVLRIAFAGAESPFKSLL